MNVRAIIFDVDGVLVRTDVLHERSWRALAEREDLPFPDDLPDKLRGVSRERSLELVLGDAFDRYTPERRTALTDQKNAAFLNAVHAMTPSETLPGVRELLQSLREAGIKLAAASASRNARVVLDRVGLTSLLHATVDGNDAPKAKPDPQCFLLAAEKLEVPPAHCVVVEDAPAGVEAAINARMAVVGVGPVQHDSRVTLGVPSLASVTARDLTALSV
ncbi:MAG: beta-phosphoglucomutase [Phycisphaera sp.]|nr:MAG: beta-phosphoglucomutase [Phycisphaera sp.]